MGVNTGDVIEVSLVPEWAKSVQKVEWRQKLQQHNGKYYRLSFVNKTNTEPESSGLIFISEEKAEAFKALDQDKTDNDKCTVTVSVDSFLYGQKKGGKGRFLVFHDKTRDIFQHRFTDGAIADALKAAQDVLTKLGYNELNAVTDAIKGTWGDRLEPFKPL
ncbi:uncharacterized protein N7500_000439 [Penicillium coprophilum]|uniref:uncharacterized protein n=1 Tax=Penicillium coprophilum TaxID=36646 RepID=UPI00238F4AB9|nr:uncharacterized protein N7500_000439 [Penicillium coprophilum]KAJ5177740.1 hypothetical protein N7500_000439 [Penicillium coprophilum]